MAAVRSAQLPQPQRVQAALGAVGLGAGRVGSAVMADAGYSRTPQQRKLGIHAGAVAVIGRPAGWNFAQPLPDAVTLNPRRRSVDIVLAFVPRARRLSELPKWADRVFPAGSVWVAWPRRAAGYISDVTENGIRAAALDIGLVDVKVAAIDEDWSALKLVWRKERRAV